MNAIYVISKKEELISSQSELDHRVFVDLEDARRFILKNREFELNIEYAGAIELSSILKEGYVIEKENNKEKINDFISKYKRKPVFLPIRSGEVDKINFGLVTDIKFANQYKYADYLENEFKIDYNIEIGTTIGYISYYFGMFNWDYSRIVDDREYINTYKARKSRKEIVHDNKSDFIYFIKDEISECIKIGYTKDVQKRLSQLQTSNPRKLSLLKVIDGDTTKESKIHKKFAKHRLNGEWFSINDELLDYIQKVK